MGSTPIEVGRMKGEGMGRWRSWALIPTKQGPTPFQEEYGCWDGPSEFPPRGNRALRFRHWKLWPQGGYDLTTRSSHRWPLTRWILKAEANPREESSESCLHPTVLSVWVMSLILEGGWRHTTAYIFGLHLLHSSWQLQVDVYVLIWLISPSPLALEQRAVPCQL